jgi:hypothetical protein
LEEGYEHRSSWNDQEVCGRLGIDFRTQADDRQEGCPAGQEGEEENGQSKEMIAAG